MKKIISIILSLAMLFSLTSVMALADYSPAEEFMLNLNIADSSTYNSKDTLTRAEFSQVISELCGLMDANKNYKLWSEYVYGADTNNTLIEGAAKSPFEDVDASLPQYDAIMTVYKYGYMGGMTETHFGPNYDITVGEVVKVIISMLGYDPMAELKGGYPAGYMQAASTIKLTSGLTGYASSDFATYEFVSEIIYNALDIPMYVLGAMGDDYIEYVKSEETFLTECLGLNRIEGVVTDNGISSLYGNSNVDDDCLVIDGKSVFVENCEYARAYLGRQVEAFYMEETQGKRHLVYAAISPEDKAEVIAIEDYVSFDGTNIRYYNSNGRITTENISKAKLIYNGEAMGTWDKTIFENILFGEIVLSSTGSKGYDVITVKDYMVGKVTKIDTNTQKIYTNALYKDMAGVKALDLSGDDDAFSILKNSNGEEIALSDVATGNIVSVLKSANGKYLEVIVSNMVISDFVLTNYEISESLLLDNGSATHEIPEYERLNDPEKLEFGVKYTIYTDFAGTPVWYDTTASTSGSKVAILLKVGHDSNGLDSETAVRVYTSGGKLETFVLQDKITLNGKRVDAKDVPAAIEENITDAILYETDDEGVKIKAITTPLEYMAPDTDNRGWYRVTKHLTLDESKVASYCQAQGGHNGTYCNTWADYTKIGNYNHGYVYDEHGSDMFGLRFAHVPSATVFKIPNSTAKYEDDMFFSVNLHAFTDDIVEIVNGYSRNRLSIAPEVLVTASDATGGAKAAKEYTRFLISKISNGINESGDNVTVLKGIYFDYISKTTKEATYYMDENTVFLGTGTSPTALPEGYTPTYPEEPDHGEYSDIKPYSFGASGPVELSAGDIVAFSLTGDTLISSIRLCYDYSTGYRYSCGSQSNFGTCLIDTLVGYAAYYKDGVLKIAIDGTDPAEYTDPEGGFDIYKFRSQKLTTSFIYIVEESPSGVVVKKGSVEDIVTYDDCGTKPSKVALFSHYGNANYGTIIFR